MGSSLGSTLASHKQGFAVIGLVLLLFGASACSEGGHGGGGKDDAGTDATQACSQGSEGCECRADGTCAGSLECFDGACVDATLPEGVELADDVTIVEKARLEGATVSGDAITFSAEQAKKLDALTSGDVLVTSHQNGLLRRITALSQKDSGQLVAQTEPAYLEDIFIEGGFAVGDRYQTRQLRNVSPGVIRQPLEGPLSAPLQFSDSATVSLGSDSSLMLTGQVDFTPQVSLATEFDAGELSSLRFGVSGEVDITAQASINVSSGTSVSGSKEIWSGTPHRRVFFIGILPVVVTLTPRIEAVFEADASVAGQLSTQLSATRVFEADLTYEAAGGWSQNLDAQPVSWSLQPLEATGEVTATAKAALRPVVDAKIYELAGPYGAAELFAQADIDSDEPSCTLSAGLAADLGVKDFVTADEALDYSTRLYEASQAGACPESADAGDVGDTDDADAAFCACGIMCCVGSSAEGGACEGFDGMEPTVYVVSSVSACPCESSNCEPNPQEGVEAPMYQCDPIPDTCG